MAKKKKAAAAAAAAGAGSTAADAVSAVKSNPYLQRVIADDELRDNVKVAYDSAADAFTRLSSGKDLPKKLVNDKKLHKDLQAAADALQSAGQSLLAAPKSPTPAKKKKGGFLKKLIVLAVLGGGAVAASSDLRNKVLDLLFGKEEEFDYTSTTTPPPPPAPAAATPGAPAAS